MGLKFFTKINNKRLIHSIKPVSNISGSHLTASKIKLTLKSRNILKSLGYQLK